MPFIEWTFGPNRRQIIRKEPKAWHVPAVPVAERAVSASQVGLHLILEGEGSHRAARIHCEVNVVGAIALQLRL